MRSDTWFNLMVFIEVKIQNQISMQLFCGIFYLISLTETLKKDFNNIIGRLYNSILLIRVLFSCFCIKFIL